VDLTYFISKLVAIIISTIFPPHCAGIIYASMVLFIAFENKETSKSQPP
jgi:hypothetical protein